ncbi:MAG: hypothetical protein H0W83_07025 [Planctomycetes bacterium]|nr:hypothetical protein [Planctomycetota bacterium]
MPASYTIILRDCPPASRNGVATFLGKAFSLKESTCAAIASSAPIILIPGLNPFETAAMTLALSGIQRLGGVLEFSTADTGDLPKIDWPRRPQVFKREISDHLEDLQTAVPTPDGSRQPLIDLLLSGLASLAAGEVPVEEEPSIGIKPAPQRTSAPTAPAHVSVQPPSEFKNMPLPEITPFSNPIVPTKQAAPPSSRPQEKDDPAARLNEMFPEDENSGFVPNNEDITNILDRLLPDEESTITPAGKSSTQSSGRRSSVPNPAPPGPSGGGFSVFLAKIADEARRTKAVSLIAELAKIGNDEADTLSKKVIIPVLKGATKDEAESAKQKFAKIGILARVKGPE